MTISVITCTKNRKPYLALCERFVREQTSNVDQWIVSTDGDPANVAHVDPEILVIGKSLGEPPAASLAGNMLRALPLARGEWVFFMEDDDWYRPTFIETLLDTADKAKVTLIGQRGSFYYHYPLRKYWNAAFSHASMACTGVHKRQLPVLYAICEEFYKIGKAGIDISLWHSVRDEDKFTGFWNPPLYVGMKGLTMGNSIGAGHRASEWEEAWMDDPELEKLAAWMQDGVDIYANLMTEGEAQ